MRRLWTRVRSAWRGLLRADQLDAAMHEEMRFHIEMEAERLVREQGLDCDEARRRTHVAFGGVEKYKEEARETRGLHWIDAASLDARLALRMLVKYRGLTLVGGFAMAVPIAIGATCFELARETLIPTLPLEEGDRVVGLQYATTTPGSPERRVLHDFVVWREELATIEQVAGIYAMMSFPVAQRTREIGIRVALGAASHWLLLSIFGRAARQLVLGLLAGSLLSGVVFLSIDLSPREATTVLLVVAAIMLAVGLLAALGPARRGLRIQASEALRADG